jgi:hypothetical protein
MVRRYISVVSIKSFKPVAPSTSSNATRQGEAGRAYDVSGRRTMMAVHDTNHSSHADDDDSPVGVRIFSVADPFSQPDIQLWPPEKHLESKETDPS